MAQDPGSDGKQGLTHSAWLEGARGTHMMNRRILVAGGVMLAASRIVHAQSGRPMVVLLGEGGWPPFWLQCHQELIGAPSPGQANHP